MALPVENMALARNALWNIRQALEKKTGTLLPGVNAKEFPEIIRTMVLPSVGTVDQLIKDKGIGYVDPLLHKDISRSIEVLQPFLNNSGALQREQDFYDWKMVKTPERVKEVNEIVFMPRVTFWSYSKVASFYNGLSNMLYYSFDKNLNLGTSIAYMFASCLSIRKIYTMNTSSVTNFDNVFSLCRSLAEIEYIDTSKGVYFKGFIKNCENLVKIHSLDFSSVVDSENIVLNPWGSKYTILTSLTMTGTINVDCPEYCFNQMIALDKPSLLSILTALADFSTGAPHTCKLGTENLNKLTADEKQIAINKNWTLTA